jgi:hypothetical protein
MRMLFVAGSTVMAAGWLVAGAPWAVLNKVSPARCHGDRCDSFAEVARAVITDAGDFGQFAAIVRALLAIFFALCLGCLVGGWYKLAVGAQGGGQMMVAAGWGVLVVIVCVGVVL